MTPGVRAGWRCCGWGGLGHGGTLGEVSRTFILLRGCRQGKFPISRSGSGGSGGPSSPAKFFPVSVDTAGFWVMTGCRSSTRSKALACPEPSPTGG